MNLTELSPEQMEAVEFFSQEVLKRFPYEKDDSLHQAMNRFVWDIHGITISKMKLLLDEYSAKQYDYFIAQKEARETEQMIHG